MKGLSKTYKKKSYKRKHRATIKRRGKGKKRINKGGADVNPVENPSTLNTTYEVKPEKERSMTRGIKTVASELFKNGLSNKTLDNLINNNQLKGDISKTASNYGLDTQNIASQIKTRSIGGDPSDGNTVTVKIYPNNTPGTSELTLGDYRVKINKTLPSDVTTVEHFLTNTMKYIKNHVDKYKNRTTEPDTNIFPNTKFKYVYIPAKGE